MENLAQCSFKDLAQYESLTLNSSFTFTFYILDLQGIDSHSLYLSNVTLMIRHRRRLKVKTFWVLSPSLLLTPCVIMGKSLNCASISQLFARLLWSLMN